MEERLPLDGAQSIPVKLELMLGTRYLASLTW